MVQREGEVGCIVKRQAEVSRQAQNLLLVINLVDLNGKRREQVKKNSGVCGRESITAFADEEKIPDLIPPDRGSESWVVLQAFRGGVG